ncbi:MAG: YjbH domain-containing protein [Alphaproteobacteria bacterium]|uniref:YjbH domain-containing protein n=1 Tax=Candidatus Nitrobium versatile TaxID=2884831 RepID=A0A953M3Y4_9BACT|nr:YjbH domain-containing protein [Candidatus Nitrobium versatile]
MEIPTARVMKKGSYRLGVSQINPYRHIYGAISPLEGLEIDGRVTEVFDVPALTDQYGNYKDKVLDLKYQFLREGKYLPAVTLGIMDPHGTRVYASQFIVISKQIYPFDFTLGMGNGRFGKVPLPGSGDGFALEMVTSPFQWLKDSQIFGGIQFAPSNKYSIMLEYSPIQYHKQTSDPAQAKHFKDPVPSPFNIGFRYNLWNWAELAVSYQRGNQIGVNLTMPFEIGKPLIPIFDPPFKELPSFRNLSLPSRLKLALMLSGFSDIGVVVINNKVILDMQNNRFLYHTRALGFVLRAIAPVLPEVIEYIEIILKEDGIPLFSFLTSRYDLIEFVAGRLTLNEFLYLSSVNPEVVDVPKGEKIPKQGISFFYKPLLQLYLNDPSGFWKGKVGIIGSAAYHPWRGGSLIAGIGFYPFADISTTNQPLPDAVRSDTVDYLKKRVVFERFLFQQISAFSARIVPKKLFSRLSFGILETQYAGLDAEIGTPLWDGRVLVGLNGSLTKKRDPDNPFSLKKDDPKGVYNTAFVKTRFYLFDPDTFLDIKYGRFLAGDTGAVFTLTKDIRGVRLSAWYSVTDTSVFQDPINRGYHDKGFSVQIPIRLFTGRDSRAVYEQSISPWTRDVAQDIGHSSDIFDFMEQSTRYYIEKTKREIAP